MVQNAVHFGAKCSAFWCKTQGKMPLNASRLSINIRCNGINKTFYNHKNMARKGKTAVKKWGFRG